MAFGGGEGTKKDLQDLVDGNGPTPVAKLEITVYGNGISSSYLAVLAALIKLR